jgi:hypothetical protein
VENGFLVAVGLGAVQAGGFGLECTWHRGVSVACRCAGVWGFGDYVVDLPGKIGRRFS